MQATYTVTFADFKAAQRLCRRRNRGARLTFLFWYVVMPIMGLASFAVILYAFRHVGVLPAWLVGGLCGLAWVGLFPALWRPVQLRLLFRRMKEGRSQDEPLELEIDGDELISRRPGSSEGRFRQAAIQSYAEDDQIGLIFIRKKTFLPIPRRALDSTGWAELQRWLGTKATQGSTRPC